MHRFGAWDLVGQRRPPATRVHRIAAFVPVRRLRSSVIGRSKRVRFV